MNRLAAGISSRAVAPGILRASGRAIQYLMRATFSTSLAAPLPASLPVDVGGPLTVVDTGNKVSQSGGELLTGGNTTTSDPIVQSPAFVRLVGRAFFVRFNSIALRAFAGWFNGTAQLEAADVDTSGRVYINGTALTGLFTQAFATYYDLAIVLRTAGAFVFVRGGIYTTWTLIWAGNAGTTSPLKASIVAINGTSSQKWDDFRVLDLGLYDARFATDFGLATARLSGPAAGATAQSTADALIEWTTPTTPTVTSNVRFRKVDASNYWEVRYSTTGFALFEVVAGVPTSRASDATANANGARFVVIAEGAVIKGYSNNVLRWTYSSATGFQTATGVEVSVLAGGGVISELVAWPRFVTLPGGV